MNLPSALKTGASTPQADFRRRLFVANLFIISCFALLIGRFTFLQVFKHNAFSEKAVSNSTSLVPIPPKRGTIVDRADVELVRNNPGYSLEIKTKEITRLENETQEQALDRTIAKIQAIINITPDEIKKFKSALKEATSYGSTPIRTKLTPEEVAAFSVQQYQFEGVTVERQMFREYLFGPLAVHVVGYVGRINNADEQRFKKNNLDTEYKGIRYTGKRGIEQSYESVLHGKSGFERLQVSASGQKKDELGSQAPVDGQKLKLTIDGHIQNAVEKGFAGRRGALVAIDPTTGEVLAFVSAPTFDPTLMVNGFSAETWKELTESEQKPMFNRAMQGGYPIGSTIKPFMALAALHSGVRSADKVIADGGIYTLGGHKFRDSTGGRGHGMVNMFQSIAVSSDVYYYGLAYEMGIDIYHAELARFGFGQKTGIDLLGETTGILPSREYYEKRTGKPMNNGVTVSLGIGQGETVFSILQLAYATSIIANNGVGMQPHLVKSIIDPTTGFEKITAPVMLSDLKIPAADLEVVRKGMIQVNISGTGRGIFNALPGQVAGKTGTAQVFTVGQNSSYSASAVSSKMRDHSLYIAFYPADKPRIAIAAIVENAGFGATAAAPLVRTALQAFNEANNGRRLTSPAIEPTTTLKAKKQP
jgi:penicillin-binding protein 2